MARVDFSYLIGRKATVFLLFSPNPGFLNCQIKEWKAAKP